jgi:phosphoesterase RecJ-like protein
MDLIARKGREIGAVAASIADCRNILLMAHVNPDGDALGALLALGQGLLSIGKKVTMFCDGDISEMYSFLPGVTNLAADPGQPEDYDLVVLLDCNQLERAGARAVAMSRVKTMVVIDHHVVEGSLPELSVIDTAAAAAGELVWYLLQAMKIEITPEMATNIFVAISTDTGSFAFANTTAETLAVAAATVQSGASPWEISVKLFLQRSPGRLHLLGLALSNLEFYYGGRLGAITVTLEMMSVTGTTSGDTDGFVEYPRSVKGIELAVFFRENGPLSHKVSLRSKGRFNAEAFARGFGGGGHFQAAGFTITGPLDAAKKLVISRAEALMPPLAGSE